MAIVAILEQYHGLFIFADRLGTGNADGSEEGDSQWDREGPQSWWIVRHVQHDDGSKEEEFRFVHVC